MKAQMIGTFDTLELSKETSQSVEVQFSPQTVLTSIPCKVSLMTIEQTTELQFYVPLLMEL
jgi:hypothetical protein